MRAVGARRVPRAVQGRLGVAAPKRCFDVTTLAPHFECFRNVTGYRYSYYKMFSSVSSELTSTLRSFLVPGFPEAPLFVEIAFD